MILEVDSFFFVTTKDEGMPENVCTTHQLCCTYQTSLYTNSRWHTNILSGWCFTSIQMLSPICYTRAKYFTSSISPLSGVLTQETLCLLHYNIIIWQTFQHIELPTLVWISQDLSLGESLILAHDDTMLWCEKYSIIVRYIDYQNH